MFGRVFLMDCKRCFRPLRMLVVVVIIAALIILDQIDLIIQFQDYGTYWGSYCGSVDFLNSFLALDKYKVIVSVLLGTLYTSSFCSDTNTNYLRHILARVDVTTYVQARILSNTAVILSTTVLSFLLYVLVMLPFYPLVPVENIFYSTAAYYQTIHLKYPLLYVFMAGIQMGMYTAVCSSIGILFSSYQSNAFVSIGLTGLCFYFGLTYSLRNTPFNLYNFVALEAPCLWFQNSFPPLVSYFWGLLLESLLLCLFGYLFYRRMKWRMAHGII